MENNDSLTFLICRWFHLYQRYSRSTGGQKWRITRELTSAKKKKKKTEGNFELERSSAGEVLIQFISNLLWEYGESSKTTFSLICERSKLKSMLITARERLKRAEEGKKRLVMLGRACIRFGQLKFWAIYRSSWRTRANNRSKIMVIDCCWWFSNKIGSLLE